MILAAGSNWLDSFVQLITLIIVFIFVIGITYFATRIVANVQTDKMRTSNIKILETVRISNTKYIQVVNIGSRYFAIAVCKDTVTYLCELNEEDLMYDNTSNKGKSESFKAILDKFKKDKPEN